MSPNLKKTPGETPLGISGSFSNWPGSVIAIRTRKVGESTGKTRETQDSPKQYTLLSRQTVPEFPFPIPTWIELRRLLLRFLAGQTDSFPRYFDALSRFARADGEGRLLPRPLVRPSLPLG